MTLIGLNSSSGDFDNLTLAVGKGTKLTLQDVRITGDRTLLSLAGGNTLTLLGENRLIGCADASGNACPTVISGGDLTICGSGSLALQALVNNADFMGAEKSKLSIEDCTISVFKSDKLGFDGGAFCANGAELTMTNAAFLGRTERRRRRDWRRHVLPGQARHEGAGRRAAGPVRPDAGRLHPGRCSARLCRGMQRLGAD